MERALKIVKSLKLTSIVFDQAIYSKVIEIKWKEKQKFNGCVLMMEMFHILMMFMHILSKRFSAAGLRDVLIQSGVIPEGSVDKAFCKSTSNISANIPHPTSRRSHIPNIPHPRHPAHPTSRTSHIPNIPHPTHPTSHIPNIPHPEHPTSRSSHIRNMPHPDHSASRTSHIPNIPYPEHPTSPTSHISNIPHPEHPTSRTSHIPHSQYATSLAYHIPNMSHLVRQII